jgi:hypothetical protein
MSTFVIIDRALVTTDSICLTMRLESSELGCGSLTSVGVDLDQAQYNHAGSEPQSPTVDETKKELYVLAIMDELTGTPIRMATEKDVSIDLSGFDVDSINRSLINCPTPSRTTSPLTPTGGAGYSGEGFHAFHRQKSLQALLANAKGGPACDHCGVKGMLLFRYVFYFVWSGLIGLLCGSKFAESPQWRKGPEDKPILCNACGTRYRYVCL